tara:strand:- start:11442 stop:11771 length:330 start_codon:yes stop_codon:yes gene_type:complete
LPAPEQPAFSADPADYPVAMTAHGRSYRTAWDIRVRLRELNDDDARFGPSDDRETERQAIHGAVTEQTGSAEATEQLLINADVMHALDAPVLPLWQEVRVVADPPLWVK